MKEGTFAFVPDVPMERVVRLLIVLPTRRPAGTRRWQNGFIVTPNIQKNVKRIIHMLINVPSGRFVGRNDAHIYCVP